MTDVRHAFSEATCGIRRCGALGPRRRMVRARARCVDRARARRAHAAARWSRSSSISTRCRPRSRSASPLDYYTAGLQIATPAPPRRRGRTWPSSGSRARRRSGRGDPRDRPPRGRSSRERTRRRGLHLSLRRHAAHRLPADADRRAHRPLHSISPTRSTGHRPCGRQRSRSPTAIMSAGRRSARVDPVARRARDAARRLQRLRMSGDAAGPLADLQGHRRLVGRGRPRVRPVPRRLRRRRHQGRAPGRRRHAAQHGLARSARRRHLLVEARRPRQARRSPST